MRTKNNSNHGKMGRFESTYGMANRPEVRPLPDGLQVQCSSLGMVSKHELHGFVSYKAVDKNKVPLPKQMEIGEMMLTAGWVNQKPCFLVVGCQEDISSLKVLPILVLRPASFLSHYGALVSLELDLHESEWPFGHWTLTFNPLWNSHLAFLQSLTHQAEISVIFAQVPLNEKTIIHTVYRPIDPIGEQICAALDRANQHIKRLGKNQAEATEIHYLYHQLHQND